MPIRRKQPVRRSVKSQAKRPKIEPKPEEPPPLVIKLAALHERAGSEQTPSETESRPATPRVKYDPSCDPSSLEYLPDELLLYLLSFLDARELFALAQTSQRMRRLVSDDGLWKPLCAALDPMLGGDYSARTWKNFSYKALYQTYNDSPRCVEVMKDRTRGVNCLQVWRDHLYSGSEDKKVRKWALVDGPRMQCVAKFVGHKGPVNCLEVWGEHLVSGAFDSSLRLWNDEGECIQKLSGHVFSVYAAKVWNGLLYTGGGDSMRCWARTSDGTLSNRVIYSHTVSCIDVWKQYNLLVCGSFDGRVVWFSARHDVVRMHQQTHLYTGRAIGVTSIRCWEDRCCSSGSWGVWEWRMQTHGACLLFKLDFTDSLFVWQKRLYSGYDEGMRVWGRDAKGQTKLLDYLHGHTGVVKRMVAFEGSLFSGSKDGSIKRWSKEPEPAPLGAAE